MKMFMVYTKDGVSLGRPVYATDKYDAIDQAYLDEDWVDHVVEIPEDKRDIFEKLYYEDLMS